MPYPNTKIYLLENVRQDNTYTHTRFFEGPIEQFNFYTQENLYVKHKLFTDAGAKYTYLRVHRNSFRVELEYEDVRGCDYMIFSNTDEKWYYAFINEVKYVNDNTTEILFEIDVMQTYMFDYSLPPTFVEREHVDTDALCVVNPYGGRGAFVVNPKLLVEETLETGDYDHYYARIYAFYTADDETANDIGMIPNPNKNMLPQGYYLPVTDGHLLPPPPSLPTGSSDTDWCLVYAGTVYVDESNTVRDYQGGVVNGMYSALTYKKFNINIPDINKLFQWLTLIEQAGKSSGVYKIFVMPAWLYNDNMNNPNQYTQLMYNVRILPHIGVRSDGSLPKNNKMLTYPYNFLILTNHAGQTGVFKPQDFAAHLYVIPPAEGETEESGAISPLYNFVVSAPTVVDGSITAKPVQYQGMNEGALTSAITLSNAPTLHTNSDEFMNWLAKNTGNLATSALSATTAAGAGYLIKTATSRLTTSSLGQITAGFGAGMAVVSGITSALSLLGSIRDHAVVPPQASGMTEGLSALYNGLYNITAEYCCVKPYYMDIIDDFFTMYGYACHKIKIPNRNVREGWTYVKTVNCHVKPVTHVGGHGITAAEEKKINSIYDNGITFWQPSAVLGNYNAPNKALLDITPPSDD